MGSRRGKTHEGRKGRRREEPALPRIYEGIDALDTLLLRAGAELDAEGVIFRFAAAIAEQKSASQVIPEIFPEEPRFSGQDEAMRLYGNLFGVWDLLSAGRPPRELTEMRTPVPPAGEEEELMVPEAPVIPLPRPGSVPGNHLQIEVVEGIWQELAGLSPKELGRRQDRYANAQPELAEWARTAEGMSPFGQEILETLCFEMASMFEYAFGSRFGLVPYGSLESASPKEAAEIQPYAVDYLDEALDEAEDEDEPISEEELLRIENSAKQALVAMTNAVREE